VAFGDAFRTSNLAWQPLMKHLAKYSSSGVVCSGVVPSDALGGPG
jgi:hypothetical protein